MFNVYVWIIRNAIIVLYLMTFVAVYVGIVLACALAVIESAGLVNV